MQRFARTSVAASWTTESIARPFSNFDFFDRCFPETGSVGPLRRIFSQVRLLGAKTMVFEELNPLGAKDLSEENEDLEKRFQATLSTRVWRLSFFAKAFTTKRGLASVREDDFLGYAIVKQDSVPPSRSCTRIFESVVLPSRQANNFVRGSQSWPCRVGDATLRLRGYVYAQQNGWTNVCAHVACRTAAARFHGAGDMAYREMNDLPQLGIDHLSRTVDDGLTSAQMVAILEAAGARCVVADYTAPVPGVTPPPFQKYVYGSIESGYPAILCFATSSGDYHAIPVFGHTFNEDMWVPNAELSYFRVGSGTVYLPSEQWLSTYLVHDDNWGSNYCIPRHFLYTKRLCDQWPGGPRECVSQSDCVACVISTLPAHVQVNPIEAEVIGADYLFRMLPQLAGLIDVWGRRLEEYARKNLLILRPILLRGSGYVDHLGNIDDWEGHRARKPLLASLKRHLQGDFWMVELSVPELFSANRRKLGEVLLVSDTAPGVHRDFRNYVLARVPGHFAFHTGGDLVNPQFSFVPSGIAGHVPLFGCERM